MASFTCVGCGAPFELDDDDVRQVIDSARMRGVRTPVVTPRCYACAIKRAEHVEPMPVALHPETPIRS